MTGEKVRVSLTLTPVYTDALDIFVESGFHMERQAVIRAALRLYFEVHGVSPFYPGGLEMSRIRVGLESTKVLLTDVGKKWFTEHYPQGIVYEYDPDGTFDLKSIGADFVEVICPMGIPYRFPSYIDGEITFNMADKEAEG